ncbi:MAG: peptide chain release factor N(5)-glutamine methyltransferase [Oscillospiraceae bacterium]|nr:peptide chain release factor N(5)-glutamine methyltransferase [Oscillospiraceae bacterium]
MTRQETKWLNEFAKKSGQNFDALIKRRENGEPLQYILGEWEFYGYNFKVGKGVLIPRPETELLVDLAKEHCDRRTIVVDLCAGTGCVGIALAKEIKCKVIAVEKSEEAIYYLKQNIELNDVSDKVEIIQGDVLKQTRSLIKNEVVLINSPYLSKQDMQNLQKEVTYEPKMALYGGDDGLDFYRQFFSVWKYLQYASLFACEVGDGQAEAVCKLMIKIGLNPKIKKDYSGIERVIYAIKT